MPEARLPAYSQVEALLKGPSQSFTLSGFSGIAQARSAAQTISGQARHSYSSWGSSNTSCSSITTYSVRAEAVGTGKHACVNITKTQDWYQRHVQSKQVYKRELQAVEALRR